MDGLSSARNAGIDIATGKYIAFVDSDDYIAENFIEKLYLNIKDADFIVCGTKKVYEDGSIYNEKEESPIKNETLSNIEFMNKFTLSNYFYYVTAWNKLYKRSLFDKLRFRIGKIHEDEFFINDVLVEVKKIITIKDELYFYVQRDFSIMHSPISIKRTHAIEASLERIELLEKKGLYEERKITLRRAFGIFVQCINNLSISENKEIFFALKKQIVKKFRFDLRTLKINFLFYKKYFRENLAFFKFKTIFQYKLRKSKNKQRVYMMGTPTHGNIGDQALILAEERMLNNCGYSKKQIIEVRHPDYLRYKEYIEKYISDKDLIIIGGGGSLGTLWLVEDDKITDIIKRFKNNKIIIFPQTCYYDESFSGKERLLKNIEAYKNKKLYVFLRDKKSYEFCKRNFNECNLYLCPDIVLSLKLNLKSSVEKKDEVLLCFRTDLEKTFNDVTQIEQKVKSQNLNCAYTSMVVDRAVTAKTRKKEIFNKFREFSKYPLVITDRLHAMIFCALVGTPCIAFDNVSKKVSGVYKWIEKLDYIKCIPNVDDIDKYLNELKDKKENEFFIEYNNYSKLMEILK